jgi:hypothetical protein
MAIFTVAGVLSDTLQRYCDWIDAKNAEEAEELARKFVSDEGGTLLAAAVFSGEVDSVDEFHYADEGPGGTRE